MKSFSQWLEDAGVGSSGVAANSAGAGNIAGIGVGSKGEPGVYPKKKKRVVFGTVSRKALDRNNGAR